LIVHNSETTKAKIDHHAEAELNEDRRYCHLKDRS